MPSENPYQSPLPLAPNETNSDVVQSESASFRQKLSNALLIFMGSSAVIGITLSMRNEMLGFILMNMAIGTTYLYALSKLEEIINKA